MSIKIKQCKYATTVDLAIKAASKSQALQVKKTIEEVLVRVNKVLLDEDIELMFWTDELIEDK